MCGVETMNLIPYIMAGLILVGITIAANELKNKEFEDIANELATEKGMTLPEYKDHLLTEKINQETYIELHHKLNKNIVEIQRTKNLTLMAEVANYLDNIQKN